MLCIEDVERRLLPASGTTASCFLYSLQSSRFKKLTKDPHWGVKRAVAEHLVQLLGGFLEALRWRKRNALGSP